MKKLLAIVLLAVILSACNQNKPQKEISQKTATETPKLLSIGPDQSLTPVKIKLSTQQTNECLVLFGTRKKEFSSDKLVRKLIDTMGGTSESGKLTIRLYYITAIISFDSITDKPLAVFHYNRQTSIQALHGSDLEQDQQYIEAKFFYLDGNGYVTITEKSTDQPLLWHKTTTEFDMMISQLEQLPASS